MKKLLALALAALMLCLAACSNGAQTTSPPDTTAQQPGGTTSQQPADTTSPPKASGGIVRAAMSSDTPTIDPQGKTPNTFSLALANHMYEGLVRTHGNEILPGMAERWEISDDGLVYTFYLRDAVWSDGAAVTAHDFVTGMRRLVDPMIASNNAQFGYYIVNGEAINNGELPAEELAAKAIDDKTLEITITQPIAYYLTLLGQMYYYPVRADVIAQHGDRFASSADTIVYNGPFVLTEWRVEDRLTFAKNESYWNADAINLDGLEFLIVGNSETAAAMFDAGQVDYVNDLDNAIVPLYADKLRSYSPGGINFARFNLDGQNKIIANKNFRLAFNAAFDATEFITLFSGGINEMNRRIVFPGVKGAQGSYGEEYPFGYPATPDLEKAQQYLSLALEELGLSSAGDITLELLVKASEQNRKEGTILQDMMLKNLGINLTIRSLPNAEWLVEHREHTYEIIMAAWSPDYNDPLTYMDVYLTNSSYNHASYYNDAFDALVAKANSETDAKARLDLLFQAEQMLLDDAVACPTYLTERSYLQVATLQNVILGFQSPAPDFVYAYFD